MSCPRFTMMILSCDGYSDLWSGYFKQLGRFWPDAPAREIVLVTDRETEAAFPGVRIAAAGEDRSWTGRLRFALETVPDDYVLLTLDDYYLTDAVRTEKLAEYLRFLDAQGADYFRLYPRPKRAAGEKLPELGRVCRVDPACAYSVNLYTGFWRTDFLRACLEKDCDIWAFESTLYLTAAELGARCYASSEPVYPFLDVVRKGKLLHKSAAYFKKNPGVYTGTRAVNTWRFEAGLWVKTMVGRHSPRFLRRGIKRVMRKLGYHFYSP